VGVETFGAGSTYDFVELDDGSAIYMPVRRWFTPSGRPLAGGVQPDFLVAFQQEPDGFGRESQFNTAYELLDAQLPPFR
jgi:C-terminal processing protease CtpA/Prc